MRNNLVVIVVAALIVSYLLISPFAGDRAVGQQKVVPASATGRYQMAVGQITVGNKELVNDIYVLDTQTGQVWQRYLRNGKWEDLGNPIPKDKKE
jgi:hypothetical protein